MFSITLHNYEKQLMCRLSMVDHNGILVLGIYAEEQLLSKK